MQRVRIVDGCLDVVVGKVLERIYTIDDLVENLVKDIVDTRAAEALNCNLINKSTVYLLVVVFQECVDQVEHDLTLVTFNRVFLEL